MNNEASTNVSNLQFLEFMSCFDNKSSEVEIVQLESQETIMKGKVGNLNFQSGFSNLKEELDFMKKLVAVEKFFEKKITIPDTIV